MNLEKQLQPFKSKYSPSFLEDFYLYWAGIIQKGKYKGQERWQPEKTWSIALRLRRWEKNEDRWQWEKEQRQKLKLVDEKPVNKTERGEGFSKINF